MKLLTILILSSNRYDLLSATIHSLLSTMSYPDWELIVYNHTDSIGAGWNELIKRINGDYILWCQDDWYFIEQWNWMQKAMKILDENPNVGIVRLRKEEDGQNEEKIIKEINDGVIVECIGSGFSLNPFLAKKDLIEELGSTLKIDKQHGSAEVSIKNKYNELGYKTAKLNNPAKGVCIHIGRGRRCSN